MDYRDTIAASHAWRVRFETPDGMFTFVDLRIGDPLGDGKLWHRDDAEKWAAQEVQKNPSKYARVAKVYAID